MVVNRELNDKHAMVIDGVNLLTPSQAHFGNWLHRIATILIF